MRRSVRWPAIPALATVAWGANPPPAFGDDPLNGQQRWLSALTIKDAWGTTTGDGMVGRAPDTRILPVAAMTDALPTEPTAMAARETQWAGDHGVAVANLSTPIGRGDDLPDHRPPDLREAVRHPIDHDVVVVAVAGDEGADPNPRFFPASRDGVPAIGAVDSDNGPWERSERRDYVDVVAPGVRVAQTRPGQVTHVSGTSAPSTPASDDGDNPALGNGIITIAEALAATDTGDTRTGTGGGSDQDAAGTGADGVSAATIAGIAGAGATVILVLVAVVMTTRRRRRAVSTAVSGWPPPNGNPPST